MASILDEPFQELTSELIISKGFERTTWGAPKKIIYPESNTRNTYRRNAKLIWDEHQYCWMLFDEKTDDYWRGLIYYYPESFDGYVSVFQGTLNWRGNNPSHPAGYAYITIDNSSDDWYKIIKIDCPEDLDLAMAILKRKYREKNKLFY